MSDPTADKTEHSFVDGLDDDDVDALLDRLAERADERDLQLPGGSASRRGVLAALLGAGGIGAAGSQAAAIGESESYGSSTGVAGTDSEPLSEINAQDAHVQDLQVDNLLEAEQLSTEREMTDVASSREFDQQETNNSGSDIFVSVVAESNSNGTQVTINFTVDGVTNVDLFDQFLDTDESGSVQAIVPAGVTYEIKTFGDTGDYSLKQWKELR